jgi:hypothetical protein
MRSNPLKWWITLLKSCSLVPNYEQFLNVLRLCLENKQNINILMLIILFG